MHLLWLLLPTLAFATSILPRQSSATNYTLSPDEKDIIELLTYIRHISHDLFQAGCDGFNEGDWVTAGFSNAMPPNICRMANQSSSHIDTLNGILDDNGSPQIEPCNYTFVYSEPTSYISLANEVLMWSVSAYLGALPTLTSNPSLLTLIASQLSILSRHNSYLRASYGAKPAPSTLDTPLPPAWAYNIAQSYIIPDSCKRALGYSVTPHLNVSDVPWKDNQGDPDPEGTEITISYDPSTFWAPQEDDAVLYLALVNQLENPLMVSVERVGEEGGVVIASAVIPAGLSNGVVYAALTTFSGGLDVGNLTEFGTLAGPVEIVVS